MLETYVQENNLLYREIKTLTEKTYVFIFLNETLWEIFFALHLIADNIKEYLHGFNDTLYIIIAYVT